MVFASFLDQRWIIAIFLRWNSKYFAIEHARDGGRGAIMGESLTVARVKYRLDVMMHSASNGAQVIDDNFFQHLHSIHKCAIKYVNKYFFFYGDGQSYKWLAVVLYVGRRLWLSPPFPCRCHSPAPWAPGVMLCSFFPQCSARLHHQLCLSKQWRLNFCWPTDAPVGRYASEHPLSHFSSSDRPLPYFASVWSGLPCPARWPHYNDCMWFECTRQVINMKC